MIHEDEDVPPPPIPPRSHRRSTILGQPTAAGAGEGLGADPDSAPGQPPKIEGIDDREWLARRGGWRRLAVLIAVLTVVVIGLAVGLTVGLHRR